MKLDSIGKILAVGFGDKVLIGILLGILQDVTPYRCYEYIKNNMELFHWASESDLNQYRAIARHTKVGDITTERVIEELRKYRADLLGVILNTPGGKDWIDGQILNLRSKLL